jgi:DNA-binding transcriptional ArsR family regulator
MNAHSLLVKILLIRLPGCDLLRTAWGAVERERRFPIDPARHFDNSRSMDATSAVRSLAALAQESRLDVFRVLVQAGPAGRTAGEIAERLGIPPSTLSFHVKALSQAGLVESRQAGRFIHYSANFPAMSGLIAFLGENCCGGVSCAPVTSINRAEQAP